MEIVTDLKFIEQMAKEKDDENWGFRTYLKGSRLSGEELDAIVHQLNEEVTAKVDCTACANCCKKLWTGMSAEDAATFASSINVSFNDFEEQYLSPCDFSPPEFQIQMTPCPFLEDNRCSNYENRPMECRDYPYLHRDGFRQRLIGVVDNYAICPIVYNVYEELKARLWRGRAGHRRYRT